MIEDELRSLLTERAGALPDNPARPAEVRSRIPGIRRRRVAGTALGLVLLALAGLAVLRLPGTDESLPPGVPAPPWFHDVHAVVPGYTSVVSATDLDRPYYRFLPVGPLGDEFGYLVVARCREKSELTLRNLANGRTVEVDCSRPVGDHFEGAAAIDAEASRTMLAERPGADPSNIRFEPGAPGQEVALLKANAPDRLPRDPGFRPLAAGWHTPDGTTVEITVPG